MHNTLPICDKCEMKDIIEDLQREQKTTLSSNR